MNGETGHRDSVFPKNCLGQKESKLLQSLEEPGLADVQPPRSKIPRRGRRDTSAERDFAKVREAH